MADSRGVSSDSLSKVQSIRIGIHTFGGGGVTALPCRKLVIHLHRGQRPTPQVCHKPRKQLPGLRHCQASELQFLPPAATVNSGGSTGGSPRCPALSQGSILEAPRQSRVTRPVGLPVLDAALGSQTDRRTGEAPPTPSPAGTRTAPAQGPALCRDTTPGAAGTRTQDGGSRSGLKAAPELRRARRRGRAPTEVLALLDPRQQLHDAEHLGHVRLPVQRPHKQRCGTNGWSGLGPAPGAAAPPGPAAPGPAPRTLHDVAELAEIPVAPGAVGLYGPVEVELQDPAVHGLLRERRHPGPVGLGVAVAVGVPLSPRLPPRLPPRRHRARPQRAGSDDTNAAPRTPRRAALSSGLLAYSSRRALRQARQ